MKQLLLLCLVLVGLSNCNRNEDDLPELINCASVACTNEFVTLTVSVKDQDGVLIPLDRYEVIDLKTAEEITPELTSEQLSTARRLAQYPMYSDAFLTGNQNTYRDIVFRGFINEEKLVEAEYRILTDCCHVSVAAGNTNVIID